jgi:ABC-type transporter Mla subunit MlaD
MKLDVKNVAKKLGRLEATLKKKLESGVLFNEVRRFADGQAKTLRQKVKTSKDAKKVIAFVDQRKKQIEKIAADLPKEVKTMRTYIEGQRKELEKIGNDLIKKAREGKINAETLRTAIRTATTKKAAAPRKSTAKKATRKKAARKTTAKRAR